LCHQIVHLKKVEIVAMCMAHPVILATWEAEIWEDYRLRPAWAKSSQGSISTTKMLGVVVQACHLSYARCYFTQK
jgi:hypothetical protein